MSDEQKQGPVQSPKSINNTQDNSTFSMYQTGSQFTNEEQQQPFSMYIDQPEPLDPPDPEKFNPWDLVIRDQVGNPISGLHLWLFVDGKELPFTTGVDGKVSGIPRSLEPIKVEIEKHTGGRKPVAELKLLPQTNAVALTSPKIKIEGRTRISKLEDENEPEKNKDPVKKAARAKAKNSGLFIEYKCHSSNPRERNLWEPDPYIKELADKNFPDLDDLAVKLGMREKNDDKERIRKRYDSIRIMDFGLGNTCQTRDEKGSPVTVVGIEGWDGRLALGPNEKWRPALEEAMALEPVKKTGIKIFTLAAVINAEAGTVYDKQKIETIQKDKKGDPIINKTTGKPVVKTRTIDVDLGWNERVHNKAQGDAAGLTQFIQSSWCDMAKNNKTQLGQYARKRGWIIEAEILSSQKKAKIFDANLSDKIESAKKAKEDYEDALRKYHEAPKGKKKGDPPQRPRTIKTIFAKDATSYQKLLDLREDGRMSILTAAEAMAMNFSNLKSNGCKVEKITNPFEVARLAYYLHFLGPSNGLNLMNWTMKEEGDWTCAKELLLNQVGGTESGASSYLPKSNSDDKWKQGLRNFAEKICNDRLNAGFKKYCQPPPKDTELGRNLSDILRSIKPE